MEGDLLPVRRELKSSRSPRDLCLAEAGLMLSAALGLATFVAKETLL